MDSEMEICSYCRHNLPLACFHHTKSDEMKMIFYGRFLVENATALLYFRKGGLTQKFIHALKYKGARKIGATFGKWLGTELATCENYKGIDVVIPVPLHRKKLRERGFNQVEDFGKEIALALNIPYIDDVLLKITPTSSQVFKARLSRLFTSAEMFAVIDPEKIKYKHILLLDDIITTGSTLEACANKLLLVEGVKISVATIAITK